MMKTILVSYFLFGLNTYAADSCLDSLGGREEIRLDDSGAKAPLQGFPGSLAGFKVQDQDGLGTCYANSAALMLQSVLKEQNYPSLSYLHLSAVYSATGSNTKKRAQIDSQSYVKPLLNPPQVNPDTKPFVAELNRWDLVVEGGDTCAVINDVKQSNEAICNSNKLNLETMAKKGNGDTEWLQKKSMKAVFQYMEDFQKGCNQQSARDRYQNFKVAMKQILDNKEKSLDQKCSQLNAEMLQPLLDTLSKSMLAAEGNCFKKEKAENANAIGKCYDAYKVKAKLGTNKENNSTYVDLNSDVSKYITDNLKPPYYNYTNEKIQKILRDSLVEKNNKSEKFNNVVANLKFDNEQIATVQKDLHALSTPPNISKRCKEKELINYLTSANDSLYSDARAANLDQQVLCNSQGLLDNFRNVILTTIPSGISTLDRVRSFLLDDSSLRFDKVIRDLYAVDCADSDKIAIPKNMKCVDTKVTSAEAVRPQIIGEILKNRAVGGSVCADIINKTQAELGPNWNCDRSDHAVTIIGVKCEGGKLKYLVQNSWGINSIAKNEKLQNAVPNQGAYWFDEDSFTRGFREIKTMNISGQ